MAVFGKFHLAIGRDVLRPNLMYAIVENGNFVFTDGHVLGCIPVDSWIDDLEGFAEGKAFDYKLLKAMALEKYNKLVFTEKTVQLFESADSEKPDFESFYSGEIVDSSRRTFAILDSKGKQTSNRLLFPDWPSAIPEKYESKVSNLMLNPELLNNLYGCFNTITGVKLVFGNSIPIKVMAMNNGLPDESKGWGIIMPIKFK